MYARSTRKRLIGFAAVTSLALAGAVLSTCAGTCDGDYRDHEDDGLTEEPPMP